MAKSVKEVISELKKIHLHGDDSKSGQVTVSWRVDSYEVNGQEVFDYNISEFHEYAEKLCKQFKMPISVDKADGYVFLNVHCDGDTKHYNGRMFLPAK